MNHKSQKQIRIVTKNNPSGILIDSSITTHKQYRVNLTGEMPNADGVYFANSFLSGSKSLELIVKINTKTHQFKDKRFQIETKAHQALNHENIIKLYDVGEVHIGGDKHPFLLMDKGYANFWQAVKFQADKIKGLQANPDWLKSTALQMLNGLAHLHSKRIIHRDIKPANFVFMDSKYSKVAMIDFGLAKFLDAETDNLHRYFADITKSEESVGPKHMFSPELIRYAVAKTRQEKESVKIDGRSDLWQFGRAFWFLITGNLSSGRPSPKVDPTGGKISRIIDDLLHEDPDERIQTIEEIVARFQKI